MSTRCFPLLLAALLGGVLPAQPPSPEQIQTTIAKIAEITGMQAKRPVPVQTLSREEWKVWVDEQIKEQVKPEEIRAEELALKMFGLVPRAFDLRAATVDLLGEQAAAVYDHRKKRMIFVEGAAAAGTQDAVLIHELAHAVADQNFNISRFIDKGPRTDESQFARLAVVEGQAMWIMMESVLNAAGQSLKGKGEAVRSFMPAMGQMAAGQFPVFEKAPIYLRESLLFPYTAGLLFQQAALDKLGNPGFAEVLRNPPSTSQHILHPETWLARSKPAPVSLPAAPLKGYSRIANGDLGEFDLQIFLREAGLEPGAAATLAAAWRGGAYDLHERKGTKLALLRWVVRFDAPASAAAFLENYRKILNRKAGPARYDRETGEAVSGVNEDGRFEIRADGETLTGLEGLQPGEPLIRPGLY